MEGAAEEGGWRVQRHAYVEAEMQESEGWLMYEGLVLMKRVKGDSRTKWWRGRLPAK